MQARVLLCLLCVVAVSAVRIRIQGDGDNPSDDDNMIMNQGQNVAIPHAETAEDAARQPSRVHMRNNNIAHLKKPDAFGRVDDNVVMNQHQNVGLNQRGLDRTPHNVKLINRNVAHLSRSGRPAASQPVGLQKLAADGSNTTAGVANASSALPVDSANATSSAQASNSSSTAAGAPAAFAASLQPVQPGSKIADRIAAEIQAGQNPAAVLGFNNNATKTDANTTAASGAPQAALAADAGTNTSSASAPGALSLASLAPAGGVVKIDALGSPSGALPANANCQPNSPCTAEGTRVVGSLRGGRPFVASSAPAAPKPLGEQDRAAAELIKKDAEASRLAAELAQLRPQLAGNQDALTRLRESVRQQQAQLRALSATVRSQRARTRELDRLLKSRLHAVAAQLFHAQLAQAHSTATELNAQRVTLEQEIRRLGAVPVRAETRLVNSLTPADV